MAAVHDAIEDSVGQGRIVEIGVPMFDRQLTGDQRRFAGGAIVEQFEQIIAFGLTDRCQTPIVEDQQIGAGELLQAATEATVAVGNAQFFEQAAEASVEDGEALAERGVGRRTGEPGLAEAGGAGDEDVVSGANPVGTGKARELTWIETAGTAGVEILNASVGIFELGLFEQTFQAPRFSPGELAIHEKAEAVFEGEAGSQRLGELLFEGASHAIEAQAAQVGHGLLGQHRMISFYRSVVVLGAAHVGVRGQDGVVEQRGELWLAVKAGGEDGGDRLAGPRAERERANAAGFQSSVAVLARQGEQTEASAVALFRMRLGFEQVSDDVPRRDADRPRPVQQPSRGPLPMRTMRRRHVLRDRAVPAATIGTGVAGYPLMTEQHFDRGAGDAQFDFLAVQGMRHRVVMVREFDVVIETGDARPLEVGILEGGAWQWTQRRPIEQLEPAAARPLELLERSV